MCILNVMHNVLYVCDFRIFEPIQMPGNENVPFALPMVFLLFLFLLSVPTPLHNAHTCNKICL